MTIPVTVANCGVETTGPVATATIDEEIRTVSRITISTRSNSTCDTVSA
ncbi:hypothetical protein ACFXPW_05470 [Streptomyces goshikiensis]